MTRLPSNVHSGACSSSSTRSLKCVPLALSSSSWSVRNESGLVRVAVGIIFLGVGVRNQGGPEVERRSLRTYQCNTADNAMGIRYWEDQPARLESINSCPIAASALIA